MVLNSLLSLTVSGCTGTLSSGVKLKNITLIGQHDVVVDFSPAVRTVHRSMT